MLGGCQYSQGDGDIELLTVNVGQRPNEIVERKSRNGLGQKGIGDGGGATATTSLGSLDALGQPQAFRALAFFTE